MSTHNICFHREVKKKYQYFLDEKKKALSGAMYRIGPDETVRICKLVLVFVV